MLRPEGIQQYLNYPRGAAERSPPQRIHIYPWRRTIEGGRQRPRRHSHRGKPSNGFHWFHDLPFFSLCWSTFSHNVFVRHSTDPYATRRAHDPGHFKGLNSLRMSPQPPREYFNSNRLYFLLIRVDGDKTKST
jgi:hypothetical protein